MGTKLAGGSPDMTLLRTPLYSEHARLAAKLTDFAGWEMPLEYLDIRSEHLAVRSAAGLFDLSHMGRIAVGGAARAEFLDGLSTNSVLDLPRGRARYTVFCDEAGGAVDDLVILADETEHWVVCNASNRETVLGWMKSRVPAGVTIRDESLRLGMLAIQGPLSARILGSLGVEGLDALRYFHFRREPALGAGAILSRTGYTGEDGFEIIAPAEALMGLWARFLRTGNTLCLLPCGLGARDTLRLEAALCLYGHELTREINPIEAGLSRFVKLAGRRFIGKEKLAEAAGRASLPGSLRLVGLTLDSHRIARPAQEVLSGGKPVGRVTSGTFSPTLEKSLALGYVPATLSAVGTALEVRVSHEAVPAVVTALPFYTRRK
jgi:aminomethyltransferase